MRRCVVMWVMMAALASCGSADVDGGVKADAYASCVMKDVPHVKQKADFCGEACAEMWLRKGGHAVDQDAVFNASRLDPMLARGCWTRELAPTLRGLGFDVGRVWYAVDAKQPDADLAREWAALHADLVKGVPSIVCMHYDDKRGSPEHFRLVLGYDVKSKEVIYHEPAEARGAYRRMKLGEFLKLWPLKYSEARWTVVRMRLAGDTIAEPNAAEGFTNADYAQHLMALKKRVPKGFMIVLERPFFVIGDESAERVRLRSARTVRWAVTHLKDSYFKKDPADILDIWLFRDKSSYRKYTKEIFGDDPDTPFGYYSEAHKALIMNIATGGGTLVHEIVHPFVASNFPGCPAWLNEGLGSLYEQCGEKGGKIVGYTNWRLAGLQKAIRAGKVPPFADLCASGQFAFYNMDKGTNYAQARYLCYYLQQKGLLRKFYGEFHASRKTDPTGYKTLRKVLGEKDMDAFKKRWEQYVMGLRFP